MKLPENTKIQNAELLVKDLNKQLDFYSNLIGLKIISKTNNSALLSATGKLPYLLKLTENKNANIHYRAKTGLFHIAFRFPSRKELAKVFLRLFKNNVKFQGFSDHLVSEAIYLNDPEFNGIELYADKPMHLWEYKFGQIIMDTLALNLSLLTKEIDDNGLNNEIHPDTDIGHIHLKVSDLNKAEKFFSNIIGLNITNSSYNGALFFAAGNYHHHIGTNIWHYRSGIERKPDDNGLINFTINIPDENILNKIKQNALSKNLKINSLNNNQLEIIDFDNNKITLSL
jgi:catechol 2,3-dioxygenase